ncbi:MAG: hypothetical protein ABI792_01210 [bacterium]
MIRNNAILILNTFSIEEAGLFDDFLNSPFHNKNTKVIQLFNVLKKYHPHYNDDNISGENLFKELFGKLKYRESYIRNLFSDLNILAEKFLQYIHINNNYTYDKLLIEELNNRDITGLMEKKVRLFEKKINTNKSRDEEFYGNRLFIYTMLSFAKVDKTLTDRFREDQILSIIKSFMISLMESSFYQLVEEQRVKIKHNYDFLIITLEYLKHHLSDFKDSPLLLIFYYLWVSLLNKNDDENFTIAKNLFRKYFSVLTQADKKNIYSVMQVYYINKIDSGKDSYSRELLNLFLEMLKFNIVSHKENDIINLNLFRNIIVQCIKLNEIKILKKFILKYIIYVRSESRASMSAYSYAHLNFLQDNFEKALELCNEINFNDLLLSANENLFFKNDIKKLSLMCLYELNSIESAMSNIDAHKHFLRNSRLIKENTRIRIMNFLGFVNDLLKLKINFDDFKLAYIKNKLLTSKELTGREWLLQKIEEMEKDVLNNKS